MIALTRIDDRLVHGQVVEGWLPSLRVRRILVVSDEAAEDPAQAALMRLALPEAVTLEAVAVRGAAAAFASASASAEKVLVLAPGPAEVLAMLEAGADISEVNVGGLHYEAGHVQLGKAIFLSLEDIAALKALSARGVRLEGRAVPTDRAENVMALIEEKV